MENNKHFVDIGLRTKPGIRSKYSTVIGGTSSTATVVPYPIGYQKRTPGKILKVKIWKISKDFDDMLDREVNKVIENNPDLKKAIESINPQIFISSRKAE